MGYKFSPSTHGFYHTDVHTDIPADAADVTDEGHAELMAAQTAGMEIIVRDEEPVAVARSLTRQQCIDRVRARCWQALGRFKFGEHVFAADDVASNRLNSVIGGLEGRVPNDFMVGWEDVDFVPRQMTLATLKDFRFGGVQHVQACFAVRGAKIAAIKAAGSDYAAAQIDWDAGWPGA